MNAIPECSKCKRKALKGFRKHNLSKMEYYQILLNNCTHTEEEKHPLPKLPTPEEWDAKPKEEILFEEGERVLVRGWDQSDIGIIRDISWTYHIVSEKFTWGFMIDFENDGTDLPMIYIPQVYLEKIIPEPIV